ncbi:MAG: LysR family transcriptional regulator [Phycisphaerae bacterium]|nr:LysR family transcriptional regulator [Phycisphaerae bacterium]
MTLETLRVFCDVVRCQSFSRCATLNHITQSAVSQAVQQLEKQLGVQLIDRTKRPFVLTPEGEVCYEGLKDVLQSYDGVEARVRSLRQEVAGVIRVAAIYSVGLHDMSRCMQEFMTRYPKAKVRLAYLRPNKVYDAVVNEEADLGIVSYPVASRGLTVLSLRSERMVLVCHPDHHLARLKKATIVQLRGENFVAFDHDLIIRKELDRHLRDNQVVLRVVMEFDNIETIKEAIQIGAGVSILPEPTVRREVERGALVSVPLAASGLCRPIGIIHRQRKLFTPTIAKFVELLRSTQGDGPGQES